MASGVAMAEFHAQPADLDTITDFAAAVASQVSKDNLDRMSLDLAIKTLRVKAMFDELANYSDARLGPKVLAETFLSRRKLREISATTTDAGICDALLVLADSSLSPLARVAPLIKMVQPLGEGAPDVAYELLHFLEPTQYCLATSWVWNPLTETGAIKLLLAEEFNLFGENEMDSLSILNFATEYLGQTIDAAGLLVGSDRYFAMDVFLAGVYGVYMSTVLEMRMTKEFKKILPPLDQLMRRLLGIYQKEVK